MSRCDKSPWLVVSGCLPAPILLVSVASWIIMATEEHGAAPWTTSTESCVHVTSGGVATEEDVRAPRRPHNWSSELLWPYLYTIYAPYGTSSGPLLKEMKL